MIFYDDNDTLITLSGLTAAGSGAAVSAATVTVTVKDTAGDEVAGATWPMSMPPVVGSAGTYRAVLPAELAVTPERQYTAEISVDAGSNGAGLWRVPFMVRERTR